MGNCLKCFQTTTSERATGVSGAACAGSTSNMTSCVGGLHTGINANLINANERNINGDRSHETDELLSARSPLKISNNCDTKRNSFKKSLLNGNTTTMSDIITTVKESMEVSDNTLNQLFEEYKDPEEDMILAEGIERLCRDLNYLPDEFAILVLAWCLDASQMCRFTKVEFIEGLHKMCADSITTIRIRLEHTIELLKVESEMFKQLYRFTFRFGLEPDQRILTLDMAISLWKLVFTVHTPELLGNWIYFLEQHPSIRGIPKDTWNMFLNFAEQCDINNYDDTEAWPSLFDDFVEYERTRLQDGIEAGKTCIDANVNAQARLTLTHSYNSAPNAARDDDNNNDDLLHTHNIHMHPLQQQQQQQQQHQQQQHQQQQQ